MFEHERSSVSDSNTRRCLLLQVLARRHGVTRCIAMARMFAQLGVERPAYE
jgi:hypothetical protein